MHRFSPRRTNAASHERHVSHRQAPGALQERHVSHVAGPAARHLPGATRVARRVSREQGARCTRVARRERVFFEAPPSCTIGARRSDTCRTRRRASQPPGATRVERRGAGGYPLGATRVASRGSRGARARRVLQLEGGGTRPESDTCRTWRVPGAGAPPGGGSEVVAARAHGRRKAACVLPARRPAAKPRVVTQWSPLDPGSDISGGGTGHFQWATRARRALPAPPAPPADCRPGRRRVS